MLRRRAVLQAGIFSFGLAASPIAFAHDAPRVETMVALKADGVLDVTHTLQLSAAQRLLFKAGVIDKNDLTGLRARAQAAIYAAERFELQADETPIPLDILGAEVGGGHLYIYQTGTLSDIPKTWAARNFILRDLSPRFDNVVNVQTQDGVRSIVFASSDIEALTSPS